MSRLDPDRLQFLNIGGGQDSSALAILYVRGDLPAPYYRRRTYLVMADTGCELPETYAWVREHFIPYLAGYGVELHILEPGGPYHVADTGRVYPDLWTGFMTLSRHPTMPTMKTPDCTFKYKQMPLARFRNARRVSWCGRDARQQAANKTPDVVMVGIAANEPDRALPSPASNYELHYPLIQYKLDRPACQRLIEQAGLPLPLKSGCWCCPHAPPRHYYWLLRKHPHLFAKVEEMEEATNRDRLTRGITRPMYLRRDYNLPIRQTAMEWHRRNPQWTVEQVEESLIRKPDFAVRFGRKVLNCKDQIRFDFEEMCVACPRKAG